MASAPQTRTCSEHGGPIILDRLVLEKKDEVPKEQEPSKGQTNKDVPIIVATTDGFYKFHLSVTSEQVNYNVSVHTEVRQYYGYLSAADYPSLHVSNLFLNSMN